MKIDLFGRNFVASLHRKNSGSPVVPVCTIVSPNAAIMVIPLRRVATVFLASGRTHIAQALYPVHEVRALSEHQELSLRGGQQSSLTRERVGLVTRNFDEFKKQCY